MLSETYTRMLYWVIAILVFYFNSLEHNFIAFWLCVCYKMQCKVFIQIKRYTYYTSTCCIYYIDIRNYIDNGKCFAFRHKNSVLEINDTRIIYHFFHIYLRVYYPHIACTILPQLYHVWQKKGEIEPNLFEYMPPPQAPTNFIRKLDQ